MLVIPAKAGIQFFPFDVFLAKAGIQVDVAF